MFDYEILRVIWWGLLGFLLIGFAIMDGFDLGVATLLPFIAKTDEERRILINTVGPVWEGNQVWLVLGGGAIFAAWPMVYALSFSGFYLAMFLVLAALILRPVGFKFRSKLSDRKWRAFWDYALFMGGAVPALVFGVAVGNALQGIPFHFNEELRLFYTGGFWDLFSLFTLLCGLVSVAMLVMHGANYVMIKTEGDISERARLIGGMAALVTIALFVLGGIKIALSVNGYEIIGGVAMDGPSNPVAKQVQQNAGLWMENYGRYRWMMIAPVLGILGAMASSFLARSRKPGLAFIASGTSIFGIITTVGLSMFPFILPSSTMPDHSLLVWDSSSSRLTLKIMLIATLIFMPLILLYTAWVFRVLRGKVLPEHVRDNPEFY